MNQPGDPQDDRGPGLPDLGALGNMGDLGGLLESAQAAFSAQAEAAQQVVEGRAGGGVVTVEMSGAGEVQSVTLAQEVVDPDEIEMLQDLIVAALHDAAAQVTALQREALGAFGNLDLGLGAPAPGQEPGSGSAPGQGKGGPGQPGLGPG